MRGRAQSHCPCAGLRRYEIRTFRAQRDIAVPIAPIESMIGEETGLDIKLLHFRQLVQLHHLIVDRDGSLARKVVRADTIDQRLRRRITVHMDKHLPLVFGGIRQLFIEEFEVDGGITGIAFFLAMRRNRYGILEPRCAPLWRPIERQLDPANPQMPGIALADARAHFVRPVAFKRHQRNDIDRKQPTLCGFVQRAPAFGHDPPILAGGNAICRIDFCARNNGCDARFNARRRKQFQHRI